MSGFTTVRDLGGPVFGLKRAIDEGVMVGPRDLEIAGRNWSRWRYAPVFHHFDKLAFGGPAMEVSA